VAVRLPVVRRTLYLLFNEGYHSASARAPVRAELCEEAIRLTLLLMEHPAAVQPETHALLALMYLQAARVPSRMDDDGSLTPLLDQDRSRWRRDLIALGISHLNRSATGSAVTTYHLEAAIAAAHATAPSVAETDWPQIVSLYDTLMALAASPVVALNRAIAIAQRDGPDRGLDALLSIADHERLRRYPFYVAAVAEMERRRGNADAARRLFTEAAALGRNAAERDYLVRRAARVDAVDNPPVEID